MAATIMSQQQQLQAGMGQHDLKGWKAQLKLPPKDSRKKTRERVRGFLSEKIIADGHFREGMGEAQSHPGGQHTDYLFRKRHPRQSQEQDGEDGSLLHPQVRQGANIFHNLDLS